jgi:thiol:disulfide interchange protein DsbD
MHQRLITRLLSCLLLLSVFAPQAFAEREFLRPEKAFVLDTPKADSHELTLTWNIADGYYLYRNKFRATPETDGVGLGELQFSPSETKQDPIFGAVQVYHHKAVVRVPLQQVPADTHEIRLRLRYQGCADKGICYPPQIRKVSIPYSAPAPAAQTPAQAALAPAGNALDDLSALGGGLGLGGKEDDIIPPEKAYRPSVDSPDGRRLRVTWEIADGTYLYQDKVKVRLGAEGARLGPFEMPKADIKKDSIKPDGTIGDVKVYHHRLQLDIPLRRSATGETPAEVMLSYQGCAERGICYPPQHKNLKLLLPAIAEGDAAPRSSAPRPASTADKGTATVAGPQARSPSPASGGTEQDQLLYRLHHASFWLALLTSLGFGLLVAFTACMYPMIPILSSLIMGQGDKITPGRAFELSLAYTQGLALTYGALGIVMAVVGKSLGIQSALQTPWVLVPSVILFIALALSMFGFYQIQVPSAIQSKLNSLSNEQKGGSVIGVGLMGVISALIVGPCGGPVLLAMLAFAASSDNLLHGFLVMWLFGTGMTLPLLIMGSGGGALLPKAGTWMDTVKAAGGVIMLALALSFLERMSPTYIPTSAIMLAWGAFLICVAIYLGALRQLPEGASNWFKLWKGLGLSLLIYGATFLLGVAAGGRDTLQPLRGIFPAAGVAGGPVASTHLDFQRIKGVDGLKRALAHAKAEGKPVMLDFYADWCTYCKTMEKEIFPNPKVRAAVEGFVLLQADITHMDEQDTALTGYLNLPAPPALYFWDRQGRMHRELRLVGEPTIAQVVDHAARASR